MLLFRMAVLSYVFLFTPLEWSMKVKKIVRSKKKKKFWKIFFLLLSRESSVNFQKNTSHSKINSVLYLCLDAVNHLIYLCYSLFTSRMKFVFSCHNICECRYNIVFLCCFKSFEWQPKKFIIFLINMTMRTIYNSIKCLWIWIQNFLH